MNSKCPIENTLGFVVTSVSFNDSLWCFNFTMDESLIHIDSLVNKQDIVEDMVINWCSDAIKNDSLIKELVYARIYFQYDMMGSNSHKHLVTTISPERISNAYFSNEDNCEKIKKKIASSLAFTNAGCPYQLDEVTIMTGCRFDGVNVVYDYTIKETQGIDFSDRTYRGMLAEASRELIVEQFSSNSLKFNEEIHEMFDMCIAIDANLIYNYKGSKTSELVQIVFTPKDMVKLSNLYTK